METGVTNRLVRYTSLVAFDPVAATGAMEATFMTMTEIAYHAGVSVATVYVALRGKPIRRLTAASIARALKTPLKQLLAGKATDTSSSGRGEEVNLDAGSTSAAAASNDVQRPEPRGASRAAGGGPP